MARKLGRPNTGKPFSATTEVKAQPKRIKKSRQDPSNAYTFIPELPKRHRTSEQTLSLTRERALDAKENRRGKKAAEDEDSDDDMQARIRKVAMMIAQDDGGEVESDESDIDSDEAWEEDGSDEERWGDVFRDLDKGKKGKGKAKQQEEKTLKPKKPLTVNLDESEDEQVPKTTKTLKHAAAQDVDSEKEEDDDEDDDEEDDEVEDEGDSDGELGIEDVDDEEADEDQSDEDFDLELPSDLSGDEDEPDTLDGLDAFVSKLADGDKKRKSAVETAEPAKKRRVLPVVSGPALGDNDFGLKSGSKVDLASLIASHPSLSGASTLLPSKSKKENADVLKQGVLAAPLPTVVQDRINREAAYEKTKEEGAKWSTLMKRVKEAEHLQFPLQGTDRGGVKSSGEILSEFKPQNKHESAVHALLAQANLTETGVKQAEDEALRGKELTMEEIEERRAALRAQRELMFREEAKAKRVSKIKSKTFRKLARKRAAKQGEADLEAMDEEELEERREKMERERAKERATLKHSAKTGRWARDANAGGEDRQEARAEMFATKERLNRRIQGKGDGSESEESEDEEDSGEEGDIRQNAFDQLAKVDEGENIVPEKGLMSLKFMQKAEERKRQARKAEEAVLRADIEMFGDEVGQGSGDEDGEGKASMMKIGGTGGRMVFSGPQTNGHADSPRAEPSYEGNHAGSSRLDSLRSPSPAPAVAAEANPWLSASSTSGPSRKRNVALGANSSAADKASASLKKAKSAAAREDKVDDDAVDIETDGNKLLRQQEPDSDAEQDELLPRKKGVRFGQRDLVAEAFAGDNVVEDFATEKARIIEADAPKTEDTSLPGWGSWAGKGTKKRKANPKFLKTTPGLLESERKDAKFSNVIISEKKDKKASQYQVKDLPYPYTSVQQYEKRFENPLGAEWNSRAGHQRGTLPRVTKKKGAIIEPVRRLF